MTLGNRPFLPRESSESELCLIDIASSFMDIDQCCRGISMVVSNTMKDSIILMNSYDATVRKEEKCPHQLYHMPCLHERVEEKE